MLKIFLLSILALFVNGQDFVNAPNYDSSRQSYDSSVDPSSTQGYANSGPRAGAFWSLTGGDNGYPANSPSNERSPAPPAMPFDSTSPAVLSVPGVASNTDVLNGADQSDTAIRLTGETKGCLAVSNMAAMDSCIFDPKTCAIVNDNNITGLSLSFWVNIPNSFDTDKHYIVDTGGSEFGVSGVSVYYTNSVDGLSFNQQLYVIISVGTSFWKTVVNSLLIPYQWNNIGIRWSGSIASDGNPIGLQIFINKTSVAWKRLPTAAGPSQTSFTNNSTKLLTIGCNNNGTQVMIGRIDDLAFWYWRLMDSSTDNKPTGSSLGEIEYFDGDLQFSDTPSFCFDSSACLPGVAATPLALATAHVVVQNPYEQVAPNMEETSQAVDGDCIIGDPSTWNGPHPIDCADTRHEMQTAVDNSPNFNATQFLKALVRVVQKAGPAGLIKDDLDWLLIAVNNTGLSKLQQDLSSELAGKLAWLETYLDMVYVISKLSELEIYQNLWYNESAQGQAGLTQWNMMSQQWLQMVVQALPNDASLALRTANHTAAAGLRYSTDSVPLGFKYPDYRNDSRYPYQQSFWTIRSLTWSAVTDYLLLSPVVLDALSFSYNATVNLLATLHNSYGANLPAFLDSRVKGTDIGNLLFFVNSRIISLFAFDSQGSKLATAVEPFQFIVEHRTAQDERPFLKGAVLCVSWNYNEGANKIGAWDTAGCKLNATNDTHSVCNCNAFGDFAILMEDRVPPDYISSNIYYACLALYFVSMICLTLFIMIVVGVRQLHYEIHIINLNVALSMLMSLMFYLFTWVANVDQTSCIFVSVFMHYSYMSAYLWIALLAHYVFRAITTGLLGKIHNYFYVGYGVPAVVVCICLGANVLMYGSGMRCFGTQYHHFMAVYIGSFMFLTLTALPMLLIALCNTGWKRVKDVQDWSDVKHAMFGIIALWPFITLVWLMAVFVYLVPQRYQVFDFLFELLNSLQGLLILLFLGVVIPSFRKGMFCKYKPEDGKPKKRKWTIPYLN